MGITLEESEAQVEVGLDGTVDISSAAELKAILVEALKSGKELRISIEKATYLDVTAIQLFWAAEREAARLGTGFVPSGPAPEEIAAGLRDAGFERFLSA